MNLDELILHIAMRYQDVHGNIREAIELVQGDVAAWGGYGVAVDNDAVHHAWVVVLGMAGIRV